MRKWSLILIFPIIIFGGSILLSNFVFAQTNQTASSPRPFCLYTLGGWLFYGSGSCASFGTPTVVSDAYGHRVSPWNEFLVYDESQYYNYFVAGGPPQNNLWWMGATNQEIAQGCRYDKNGNFWHPISGAQKKVLMDFQANYSDFICPFTGKPSPPPPPMRPAVVTYEGTVNVTDLGKNNNQYNTPKSVTGKTSNCWSVCWAWPTSNITKSISNQTSTTQTNMGMNYYSTISNSSDLTNSTKDFWKFHTKNNNLSPLKQEESGILAKNIQCKQGFALIVKVANGHPSCVKPTSVARLLAHGWVTIGDFERK